jgi:RimJ/RimL family protein N-acetyltransferase
MSSIPFRVWEQSPSPVGTDARLCRRARNTAIPSPTKWIRYWWDRLRYAWRYAAAWRELHALDERTLKDVGLHRGSLHAVADACARRAAFGRFGAVRVRRVDTTDVARCVQFGRLLDPQDIRLRFGRSAALGDGDTVRRLFRLDDGKTETIGAFDSNGELLGLATVAWVRPAIAEVAFIVRSDVQRRGLGATLLAHVIRNARAAGFTQLLAQIDHGNIPARRLVRRFGFELAGNSPLAVRAQLTLAA